MASGILATPGQELLAKILKQVEYIFSNDNIWMDIPLLQHVFRHQDGYVSTKSVASHEKVKNLTDDWKVVALSLTNSKKLQLSMDKTSVRRIQPLTDVGYPATSGAVMLFGEIPSWIKTSEDVKELLGHCGPVTHAWLMSSHANVLNPIIMCGLSFYSEIASTTFAVAKFKSVEDSIEAIKIAINTDQRFRVVPLVTGKTSPSPSEIELGESEDSKEDSLVSETSDTSNCDPKTIGKAGRERTNSARARRISEESDQNNDVGDNPTNVPPKFKRRQLMGLCDQKKVTITRQPRGPDGTIGFHEGRARMNLKTLKIDDFEM
ncbi:hypothetical protein JTE90_009006 [Oedothorax gibbosus]|uniref:HTH La-type RNA-binding domain-containing protein n=1 Tax=Oedothorax gibbosus TaxID=931172 RepID=A0AAV6VJF4_9ARAC|nr:hypothetical protein JTE90_009006 [Oedothorax gibbosus]